MATAVVTILGLASCAESDPAAPHASALGLQPNIVLVLTDDLSWNLVQYMPHVLALEKSGMTFTNYTVTDSLCCPSRSSIFTGDFPHDTGVFTNVGVDGGFHIFHRNGDERRTFATALQSVGYRTAMMGKYLNGYLPAAQFGANGLPEPGSHNWVPPGWTDWDVAGDGYREFGYNLNENHKVVHFGHAARDYLTNVIGHLGETFASDSAKAGKPFFLELATFAPHKPYVPAPRDRDTFPGLRAPEGPAWNRVPKNAPPWLANHPKLTTADVRQIDRDFRARVQSVQSVDRVIAGVERTLRATGQAANTVFVFSSDNGLHMGDYSLRPGKLTAFDTDVEVPLVVVGPHIAPGRVNSEVVQNIDLAPTIETIAGAQVPAGVDGHSIVSQLAGKTVPWRSVALIEHHGLDISPNDPDVQDDDSGNPPTYEALRTAQFTYVRYVDGQHEYYDRVDDPHELDNVYSSLSPARTAALDHQLDLLESCHGGAQCWDAGQARASV